MTAVIQILIWLLTKSSLLGKSFNFRLFRVKNENIRKYILCVISQLKVSKVMNFSNKYLTLVMEKVGNNDLDEDG